MNAVLELPKGKLIQDFQVKNPFRLSEIKDLKSSILDVMVTDEREVSYIVVMQVDELDVYDNSVQYYTAKQYSSQINKGEDYPQLNQVIFIGILDFVFFADDSSNVTRHRTVNVKTQRSSLTGMEYNFIELPKFNKDLKGTKSLIEKWVYFIKNAENLDIMPSDIKDEGLKHAYEDAYKHLWTKDELAAYDYAAMRRQDERGKTDVAVRKAVEKAVEDKTVETIKEFYKVGVSIENISIATKLSIELVKQILQIH